MTRYNMNLIFAMLGIALLTAGCGRGLTPPPSDGEMLRHFAEHEAEFNEVVEILLGSGLEGVYPSRNLREDAGDSLFLARLGSDKCLRIDSLLTAIGVERVYFNSRIEIAPYQLVSNNDSIVEIREYPDTIFPHATLLYHSDGFSVGPSVDKSYSYNPSLDSLSCKNADLDSLFAARHSSKEGILSGERHIKGNWYITLYYDR